MFTSYFNRVSTPSTSPPTSMLLASILPPTLPLTLTLLPCTVRAFPSMSHVLQLSSFTLPVKLICTLSLLTSHKFYSLFVISTNSLFMILLIQFIILNKFIKCLNSSIMSFLTIRGPPISFTIPVFRSI